MKFKQKTRMQIACAICLTLFAIICFCGFISAMAGGVKWGTTPCGFIVFLTLAIAGIFSSFATMAFLENSESYKDNQ